MIRTGEHMNKTMPNGKFVLYAIDYEDTDYILSCASFDVRDSNVKVTCYLNEKVMSEITLPRENAREMWKSLVNDGYRQQAGELNLRPRANLSAGGIWC